MLWIVVRQMPHLLRGIVHSLKHEEVRVHVLLGQLVLPLEEVL